MIGNKVIHRRMMKGSNAHYANDLVNGAEILVQWGDVATELMIRAAGDISLFVGYEEVKFTAPVHVGDFITYIGWIESKGKSSFKCRFEAWKDIKMSDEFQIKYGYMSGPTEPNKIENYHDSSAVVLDPPILVGSAVGTLVVPVDKQRGPQDPAFKY